MIARTRFTRTDVDAIMSEVAAVRNQGYCLIDQEVEIGLRSIAVPLVNARGKTVAAMNVGLPATQNSVSDLLDYLAPMLSVQTELKALLA
ncbi:Pca regulon regulatory protein [compost metagenome]